jgi:hypothetical protein
MKRLIILIAVLVLGAGSVSTAAAQGTPPRVQRTVTGSYGPYPAPVTGCNSALGTFACLYLDARSKEAFFTAEVRDTHGLPVYVEVWDRHQFLASFCGTTSEPIGFRAGDTLRFHVGLPLWGSRRSAPSTASRPPGRSASRSRIVRDRRSEPAPHRIS